MSLTKPESEVRLFNVPWKSSDNFYLKFSSVSDQTSTFNSYFSNLSNSEKYTGTNYNIIKDGVIKLPETTYEVSKYNYMMFKNPDISSSKTWWYAFITKVEWLSYNSCAVYYTLDAWQNYQFSITYHKCFVERCHVNNDTVGRWLAPEPVSFSASFGRKIKDSAVDWKPAWMLNAVSDYNGTDFKYGGHSIANENATGGYSFPVSSFSSQSALESFIEYYKDTQLFQQSHLDEITGLTCTPKWVEDLAKTTTVGSGYMLMLDIYNLVSFVYYANKLLSKSEYITGLDTDTLACGYTPRNKKMLTSLAKVIVMHNKNGLTIPLKPELFTWESGHSKELHITYKTKPINCNSIKGDIVNYNSSDSEFTIPYGASIGIGYNSNEGTANFVNKLTSLTSLVGSAGMTIAGGLSGNPLAVVSGITGVANSVGNVENAFDSQYKQLGSCSDTISVSEDFITPEFWDKSPTLDECRIMDTFLDMYGYAINEYLTPNLTGRPSWNYLKVAKLSAEIDAPSEYAEKIKNAFESGVWIWHTGIGNVGNFNLNNELPSE